MHNEQTARGLHRFFTNPAPEIRGTLQMSYLYTLCSADVDPRVNTLLGGIVRIPVIDRVQPRNVGLVALENDDGTGDSDLSPG